MTEDPPMAGDAERPGDAEMPDEPLPDDADRGTELEVLLRDALRPIEPPEDLSSRMETTLSRVTEAAASELSDWADDLSEGELRALRDPRNWFRPVVAAAAGGAAGTALVVIELRRRRRQGGIRAVTDHVRSLLP